MTCGGGIQKRRRECNNPRPYYFGHYCRGPAVEYASCNTQPCPINPNHPYADAREEQCSAFNGNNFNLLEVPKNVTWVPKYGANESCVLYCRPENRLDFYPLEQKVKDGTKCGLSVYDHLYNICVNGVCRKGGCDNKLDSDLTVDICGNCGGDNSTCVEISGVVDEDKYRYEEGYIDVFEIPRGSYNINIWKRKLNVSGSYFFLAVKNETNGYIFNGNFQIQPQDEKSVLYGGLKFDYTGGTAEIEQLTSNKRVPLQKKLIIQVLKSGPYVTPINYYYMIHKEHKYEWVYSNWTECDRECNGRKYQRAVCTDLLTSRYYSDEYCQYSKKPDPYVTQCNTRCNRYKYKWVKAPVRSECSAKCGTGERFNYYHCIVKSTPNKVVPDEQCKYAPKPPLIEKCEGPPCLPNRWIVGNWSSCSVSCGIGQQTRTVKCVDFNDRELERNSCTDQIPIETQLCQDIKCPKWTETNDWSMCSIGCGKGIKYRHYVCQNETNNLPDYFCVSELKPNVTKECYSNIQCKGKWKISNWSSCDSNCYRNREVRCINEYNGTPINNCDEKIKPNYTELCRDCVTKRSRRKSKKCHWKEISCPTTCEQRHRRAFICISSIDSRKRCQDRYCDRRKPPKKCPPIHGCPKSKFRWVEGKWTKCPDLTSKEAIQTRKLICLDEYGQQVKNRYCRHTIQHRPSTRKKCIYRTCEDIKRKLHKNTNGEYYLTMHGKRVRIFCHGMNTPWPTEYITLLSDFNYAIFNDQMADNPDLLCNVQQNSRRSNHFARTYFERIRINITSLQVITNDFTYAKYEGERKMSYGTAGDCYSRRCPKGVFNIYLAGTSFQVSKKTKWGPYEPTSTIIIKDQDPKNIIGYCGGYCGSCRPIDPIGLLLEVT